MTDPDYSPAYQDEYQRLWHEAAAERDKAREELAACEALVSPKRGHLLEYQRKLLREKRAVEAERDRLVEAAKALYEEVEMAESIGICLPNRVPSLNLGDALAANKKGTVI